MGPGGASLLLRAQQLRRSPSEVHNHSSWQQLIDDLRGCPLSDEVRACYEEIVAVFPTALGVWTRWAEQEMAAGNIPALKALFSRCLLECPNVDLWFVYIRFIKKMNESKGPAGVAEVRQAYDYTLDCIGADIHAGPLWQDYLGFLSGPKPGTPAYSVLWSTGLVGGQEEAARTAALRRAYQRAIVVPTHSLELLWKNYEAFEAGAAGNKQLAQRVLGEQRPRFQAARLAYRERKRRLEGLDMTALPMPPGYGGGGEAEQLRLWRGYLDYERSNPQRLDGPGLVARVGLAYDQALVVLRGYPEVWYDYARWHAEGGAGPQAAAGVLQKGVGALPDCLLLHFALADVQEAQGQVEEAKQVYEALVTQLEEAPDQPPPAAADAAAAATVHTNGVAAPQPPPGAAAAAGGQEPHNQQQQQQSGGVPLGRAKVPRGGPLAGLPPEQQGLAWIQYMRFAQRAESVLAMRKLFMRACRMAPACPWQVYVAAAHTEWRRNSEKDVARKIFERGLAPHPKGPDFLTTPPFVSAYVDFLCDIGDITNARALFERVLAEEANRKSQPLWERYLAFEFEMGDLASALRLEKRARESLGDPVGAAQHTVRSMQLLLLRYEVQGLWPVPPQLQPHLQQLVQRGPAGGSLGAWGEPRKGSLKGGELVSTAHAAADGSAGGLQGAKGPTGAAAGGGGAAGGGSEGGGGLIHDFMAGRYPPPLQRFVDMLPPLHFLDGPLPNVEVLLDALLNMEGGEGGSWGGGGGGGVKRELEGEDDEEEAAAGGGGVARDAYRARVKQRARIGSMDG